MLKRRILDSLGSDFLASNLIDSMHRVFLFLLVLLSCPPSSGQSADLFFQKTNDFLKKYVEAGKVQYTSIDKKELQSLIDQISHFDWDQESKPVQKAFFINAYNLLVIKAVIEQYPIASPKEITGFFGWKKYEIGSQQMTLTGLEKDLILKKFKDPRLHFVLVCGAKGCPPIKKGAYVPKNLDQQLERQTALAINNPSFIVEKKGTKEVFISEIFRWYVHDFERAGGILNFINSYRAEPIFSGAKIRYSDFDWHLNDARPVLRAGNPSFLRASRLLHKGQYELKIFNALYTQKNYNGFDQLNSRSSYFSSFFQYLHGSNKRFNIGMDLVIRSHIVNDFVHRSPFKAIQPFQFEEFRILPEGDSLRNAEGIPISTYGRFGLAHIGPKIKFHPLKNDRKASLQQAIYFPIQMSVDGQTISFTQFFYDKLIGTRAQLFVEASFWMPLAPTFRLDPFLKVFYTFFLSSRWSAYGMIGLPNEVGIGTKYLINNRLEVELLYTNYAIDKAINNDRRAQTFNVGLRIMR